MNKAVCLSEVGRYTGVCPQVYCDVKCELEIDEHGSQPCLHGALSQDALGSCFCDSVPGFLRDRCELNFDDVPVSHVSMKVYVWMEGTTTTVSAARGVDSQEHTVRLSHCWSKPCHKDTTCEVTAILVTAGLDTQAPV